MDTTSNCTLVRHISDDMYELPDQIVFIVQAKENFGIAWIASKHASMSCGSYQSGWGMQKSIIYTERGENL